MRKGAQTKMKIENKEVSRWVKVPTVDGEKDQERKTTVKFRSAETVQDALELCGGDAAKVLENFNSGRWADLRTQTSNALAGKTTEQRSVDKMIEAFTAINPNLSKEQIREIVLKMPGMSEAVERTESSLPAEIPDTYFDRKKEEKKTSEPAAA